MSILIYAAKEFKKVQTTINPMSPDKASYLVTSGPFNISRNPMYLGMVFIILGSGISFGALLTPIFIVSFMIYITVFQIIPEEKVMSQKFTEWSDYSKKTRRWL
jgi:protein-S-isoprenylcysteine O-methyltransferase Ste14|tara:strand:- start:122 stop:433 length:312 start_codon:yes stop_codon:yes gene_type:complete